MKISDLLNKKSIEINPNINSKEEAINKLVDLAYLSGNIKNKDGLRKAVLEREKLSTTGIGEGIAIPHGKSSEVKKVTLAAMVVKDGVEYESLDGNPAELFFMIAAPEGEANAHLELLARLSQMLMDANFKERLLNSKTPEELISIIDEFEEAKLSKESNSKNQSYKVLAVTACPTGIAHTYMAAESLENKAKEMGISIKVETNGSGGAKNVLTREEIEKADCIIVAADKKVDMGRFDGKKVIQTKVANGIHKAEELLKRAKAGEAPVYVHSESRSMRKKKKE